MIVQNILYYFAGIGFLAMAKAKNILMSYSSPKPFNIFESEKCIEYDIQVVDDWLSYLQEYTGNANSYSGKNVLELGPGSDLGIGIYLLSKGCSQYNALDVNHLMKSTPDSFYEQFFDKLSDLNKTADIDFLKSQLIASKAGEPDRLNYVVRNDFDIASTFGEATIDLVFSQAAFEHFDNIDATFSLLSKACKPGAILTAEIDLQTHTRWIRDKDPNNIYRYSRSIYNIFWFRGIPNRRRPYQYVDALERCGWTNISVTPRIKINSKDAAYSGMNKEFSDRKNQMENLSVMLCATKT